MPRVDWSILFDYLVHKKDETSLTMTFNQLEEIIRNKLPDSAYIYEAWWANDKTHSQAKAWLNAGWKTKSPQLREKRVTFIRT